MASDPRAEMAVISLKPRRPRTEEEEVAVQNWRAKSDEPEFLREYEHVGGRSITVQGHVIVPGDRFDADPSDREVRAALRSGLIRKVRRDE